MEQKHEFLSYKGKPLVRCGDIIYYGDMRDEYVIRLTITETDKQDNIDITKKVLVQMLSTDTSLDIKDRVIKKSEKKGLYDAIDLGAVWLERELKKVKK